MERWDIQVYPSEFAARRLLISVKCFSTKVKHLYSVKINDAIPVCVQINYDCIRLIIFNVNTTYSHRVSKIFDVPRHKNTKYNNFFTRVHTTHSANHIGIILTRVTVSLQTFLYRDKYLSLLLSQLQLFDIDLV